MTFDTTVSANTTNAPPHRLLAQKPAPEMNSNWKADASRTEPSPRPTVDYTLNVERGRVFSIHAGMRFGEDAHDDNCPDNVLALYTICKACGPWPHAPKLPTDGTPLPFAEERAGTCPGRIQAGPDAVVVLPLHPA